MDIEKLAREAGMMASSGHPGDTVVYAGTGAVISRFATLVAEECAKACDRQADYQGYTVIDSAGVNAAVACAEAIRSLINPSRKSH